MNKDQQIKLLEAENASLRRQLYLILRIIEKTLLKIGKVKQDDKTSS